MRYNTEAKVVADQDSLLQVWQWPKFSLYIFSRWNCKKKVPRSWSSCGKMGIGASIAGPTSGRSALVLRAGKRELRLPIRFAS
jgi:hypothetical protein